MENQPTYQEIKCELEVAIAQAYALSTEGEREDFLARATLDLGSKLKAGLLTRTEHLTLNLKLGLFAKEALTTPISDRLDGLSIDSWDLH
jgi:hypothetical protein